MNKVLKMMLLRDSGESRFKDRAGREHYDDGRYAPMRNYMPEYYPEPRHEVRGTYERRDDGMRQVYGFAPEGHYKSPDRGNEMEYRTGSYEHGHASSSARGGKLDHETLERWMHGLKNEDGTTGAHWTVEQTSTLAAPHGVDLGGDITPELWNAAINMMYSDYCGVASKLKVNTPEFYAGMAKAFLMDKDGGGAVKKLSAYYRCIVQ